MLLAMTTVAPSIRERLSRHSIADWIGLAARLVLAGVWLVASLLKLPYLEESVLAVRGYQILPYDAAVVVGYLLPVAELILGLLLLIGLFIRPAAVLSGLILIAFIIGIAQAWARGLSIDCGCFGGGGQIALEEAQARYPWDLARDVGLLALAGWLSVRPRTPFSLERALFGAGDALPDDEFDTHPDDAAKEESVR